jgi:hypothetical protein
VATQRRSEPSYNNRIETNQSGPPDLTHQPVAKRPIRANRILSMLFVHGNDAGPPRRHIRIIGGVAVVQTIRQDRRSA